MSEFNEPHRQIPESVGSIVVRNAVDATCQRVWAAPRGGNVEPLVPGLTILGSAALIVFPGDETLDDLCRGTVRGTRQRPTVFAGEHGERRDVHG